MYERFYLCHDIREDEIFSIGYIDYCLPLYMKNIYHLIMRLNYNPIEEGTVNKSIIKINCFNEIVDELTTGNYLQPEHGVYIVDYTYNSLNEEMDSFIDFASSVNTSLGVDVHEINVFSPDSSDYSYSCTSVSSSYVASLSSASLSDEDTQQITDEDSQQSTDLDTAMYIENFNEE